MSTQTDKIRGAAQALINRWDSPQWEWDKHGGTANLIADLRNALSELEAQAAQAPSASVEQRVQDVVVSIELFNGKWHAQFTVGNQTFKLRPLRMAPLNGSGKKDAKWQADMLRNAFGGSRLTYLLEKR